MPKRKLSELQTTHGSPVGTPKRLRQDQLGPDSPFGDNFHTANTARQAESPLPTPSRSILKKRGKSDVLGETNATPRSVRKVLFTDLEPATPSGRKSAGRRATPKRGESLDQVTGEPISPLTEIRTKDRSARRKSTLRLIEQAERGQEDDDAVLSVAERVLDDSQEFDDLDQSDNTEMTLDQAVSDIDRSPLSKRVRQPVVVDRAVVPKPRRKREKEPTPPLHELAPHEQFFFQNRPASCKTSTNTLAAKSLLAHDDYNTNIKAYIDPHAEAVDHLGSLHQSGFEQWVFELSMGFSICLYGYGSKRTLVGEFATYVYETRGNEHRESDFQHPTIVVVNGYAHMLTLSDILQQLARHVLPKQMKLPANTQSLLALLVKALDQSDVPPIYLMVNSIDSRPMRKLAVQQALAKLAACRGIHLLATADTLAFNLMWDASVRCSFRFLFHDTTTFAPYTAEIDVVDQVNSLLGKSGRRIGGKDGVSYVLQSLPGKARDLFRILVAEQLASMDSTDHPTGAPEPDDASISDDEPFDDTEAGDENEPETPSRRKKGRAAGGASSAKRAKRQIQTGAFNGVELRSLYHKAVEQFACSSEMDFRTLLKEFHDHQMIESRGAGRGTERLLVPFGRDELESLLESLI